MADNWCVALNLPYPAVVAARAAGVIQDEAWSGILLGDVGLVKFIGGIDVLTTDDKTNAPDDPLSAGLEWKMQQMLGKETDGRE